MLKRTYQALSGFTELLMDGNLNPIQPENDLEFLISIRDDPSALPLDRAMSGYTLGGCM